MNPQSDSKCPFHQQQYTRPVLAYLRKKIKAKYGDKRPERIFHRKLIGLVKAELIVENDLPEWLAIGLFQKSKKYPAWIRFSTPSPDFTKDSETGISGMAVKVLAGKNNDMFTDEGLQDFVMLSSNFFFSGKPKAQLPGVKVILGTGLEVLVAGFTSLYLSFLGAAKVFLGISTSNSMANVLERNYSSVTAFQFGETAVVKWHARALKPAKSNWTNQPDENFLRNRLHADLIREQEICFDLCVQFREDCEKQKIDDLPRPWKTALHKVGTILIPRQNIDDLEVAEFHKQIRFNPGNVLPEHMPLGKVNAMRVEIYQALSDERLAHPQ